MKKKTRKERLQEQILILENQQKMDLYHLKLQLEDTYESLKPIHLITDFIENSVKNTNGIKSSLTKLIISSTGSHFLKKWIVGKPETFIGKLSGNIFQSLSYKFIQSLLQKKFL